MSIDVLNETEFAVDELELGRLRALRARADARPPRGRPVHRLVDEEAMETLHVQWMDLPGPTDVMSFPMDELGPADEGRSRGGRPRRHRPVPSGRRAQASEAGHAPIEELLLLTTHGILHLLGFDHAEPEEEKEMFELQRQLLLTFLATRGRRRSWPRT
jgi:probable rRNA maturation factor